MVLLLLTFLFLVTPIVGVCNCSMYCCTLLYVHYSIAIILMGKRELIALLNLSSWCLVMVERLFLAVPRGCLQFVIVVFPDHTHLLFLPLYNLRYFSLILSKGLYLNWAYSTPGSVASSLPFNLENSLMVIRERLFILSTILK